MCVFVRVGKTNNTKKRRRKIVDVVKKKSTYVVIIDPIIKLNVTRSNIERRSLNEIDVECPPFLLCRPEIIFPSLSVLFLEFFFVGVFFVFF